MNKNLTPSIVNDDLDYDQTYLRNKRLPKPDAQFNWTPEMIAEIKKCGSDIHYFAEKYFYIVTSDDGKQKIALYPAQKRALKALQKYRFNIINASRQSGKCFSSGTILKIRNKKTGIIQEISAEKLFNNIKNLK